MSDEPLQVDFAAISAAVTQADDATLARQARAWLPLLTDEIKRARGEASGQQPTYRLATNGKGEFRLEVQVEKDAAFLVLPGVPFDDEQAARVALSAKRGRAAEAWTPLPDTEPVETIGAGVRP